LTNFDKKFVNFLLCKNTLYSLSRSGFTAVFFAEKQITMNVILKTEVMKADSDGER